MPGKDRTDGGGAVTSSFGASLRRGLDILELLGRAEQPLRASEIIRRLALPRSSGYEMLRILEAGRYIEKASDGLSFRLGRQLHILGMGHREHVDLLKDGAALAEKLRDQTGETVQLCILEDDYLVVLLKEDGRHPVRIISKVGTRVPVNWGASGRLLVSDLDDAALRALLKRTAKPSPINHEPVDAAALVRQIRAFRKRGWAFEVNETNAHAGCVAAPVLDSAGRCVATLSIVAPEQRLTDERLPDLVAAVRAAAAELSLRLGGNS